MKKVGNVLWGLVFIILGIIFGANALGIANINIFFKGWWTLFIIVPSAIELIREKDKTTSAIFLLVGIILLICEQDIISFTMISKLIFPIILVAIGLCFLFKDVINKKTNTKIKELNNNGEKLQEYNSVFGSQEINFNGQEFKGVTVNAVFGSAVLKLEDANITKDVIINSNAIFGGIEIVAPKNVNIKVKSTPVFGGTSNKVNNKYNENLPTIYVNSTAVFGGVDIK